MGSCGSRDFPELGAPTDDFAKISEKLHEIERICTPRGVPRAPLDPLLDCYEQLLMNAKNSIK